MKLEIILSLWIHSIENIDGEVEVDVGIHMLLCTAQLTAGQNLYLRAQKMAL